MGLMFVRIFFDRECELLGNIVDWIDRYWQSLNTVIIFINVSRNLVGAIHELPLLDFEYMQYYNMYKPRLKTMQTVLLIHSQ
jgi:hypothetical protein